MTDIEQIDHFSNELDRLIDRFRMEYEISYAAVIGTLHIKATTLVIDAAEEREDDEYGYSET